MTTNLGIFTRTFERASLGNVFDAVTSHGFGLAHFNFRSAGRPQLPENLSVDECVLIGQEASDRGLRMVGVSATFNAIHPDASRRSRETAAAQRVISLAPSLGTQLVSLSSGTRDADDMWRQHPANAEPSAWRDLCETLRRLLEVAREAGVILGVEPERNNVVSSAQRARKLLDEFQDDHLQIILDGANLIVPTAADDQRSVLDLAFTLLGPDIAMVHAKDIGPLGDCAAGRGILDFPGYFELVAEHAPAAPVVLHELEEGDVPRARQFVIDAALKAGLSVVPTFSGQGVQ